MAGVRDHGWVHRIPASDGIVDLRITARLVPRSGARLVSPLLRPRPRLLMAVADDALAHKVIQQHSSAGRCRGAPRRLDL